MPIEESDQTFMHIQWISQTEQKIIFYARREEAPFDFIPRVIYKLIFTNGDWSVDSVEYLNDE